MTNEWQRPNHIYICQRETWVISLTLSWLSVKISGKLCYNVIFSIPTIQGRHDDCVQSVVG